MGRVSPPPAQQITGVNHAVPLRRNLHLGIPLLIGGIAVAVLFALLNLNVAISIGIVMALCGLVMIAHWALTRRRHDNP